jgi:hypothetical protein
MFYCIDYKKYSYFYNYIRGKGLIVERNHIMVCDDRLSKRAKNGFRTIGNFH